MCDAYHNRSVHILVGLDHCRLPRLTVQVIDTWSPMRNPCGPVCRTVCPTAPFRLLQRFALHMPVANVDLSTPPAQGVVLIYFAMYLSAVPLAGGLQTAFFYSHVAQRTRTASGLAGRSPRQRAATLFWSRLAQRSHPISLIRRVAISMTP